MNRQPRARFRVDRSCLLILLLLGAGAVPAQQETLEQRVKSAFLFNFAKFASWPVAKLSGATDPILFCVIEHDPLGAPLEMTLAGKSIESHPLLFRRVGRAEELRDCHIAYLGAAGASSLPATLGVLAGSNVLSVYEGESTERGGVVRFYLDANKVHFEINAAAAEREELQLSSRLLSVASVVRE